MTPTGRSLAFLRRCGHAADVCERWLRIPGKDIRKDLFGIGDVIACRPGEPGALLVQCTSLSNVSARVAKAKGRPELRTWLSSGNRFQVHGWYLRAGRWRARIVDIRPEDLAAVVIQAPARRRRKHLQRELFA